MVREPSMVVVIEDLIKEYGEEGHAAVAEAERRSEDEASQASAEAVDVFERVALQGVPTFWVIF